MSLSLPIEPEATKLLHSSPLALLIGMILDQQIPMEKAFSSPYVLQQRPGALAFVGVCPPGEQPARAHACHSNRMMMDEDGMQAGIALHAAVALSYLDRRATDEAESGSE